MTLRAALIDPISIVRKPCPGVAGKAGKAAKLEHRQHVCLFTDDGFFCINCRKCCKFSLCAVLQDSKTTGNGAGFLTMPTGYIREDQRVTFTTNISISTFDSLLEHIFGDNFFSSFRWDDFDTSPVTWHIDSSANIKSDAEQSSSWITTVEPWQSSVNGIY